MDDPEDARIVAGLRRGDPRAFDRAFERYHARVLAFLLRLSQSREVADDLVQETWLKLARHATTLREDTSLAAFLFTIARNAHRSHRRFAWLDARRVRAFAEGAMTFEAVTPETEALSRRKQDALETALASLSETDREVLLLVGVEGMAQDQAAIVLGIEHAAMRKRVARARSRLAAKMDELELSR